MNALIEKQLPQIIEVFKKYQIKSAYLFGSAVNKDTLNNESDVDFLYSFEEGLDLVSYSDNFFALANELEMLLKRKVDLIPEKKLSNPYFIANVNKTKIKIL